MSIDDNRCVICLNDAKLLRILTCRHRVCDNCVESALNSDPWEDLKTKYVCQLDGEATNLADGIKSVDRLPKVFFAEAVCDNCSETFLVQRQWFCNECAENVCSACAMKRHRIHDCYCWDERKVINDVLVHFDAKNISDFSSSLTVDEHIDDFCLQLACELKKRFSNCGEFYNFISDVKSFFDISEGHDDDYVKAATVQNEKCLTKKLTLVRNILACRKDISFDVQRLIDVQKTAKIPDLRFLNNASEAADTLLKKPTDANIVLATQEEIKPFVSNAADAKLPKVYFDQFSAFPKVPTQSPPNANNSATCFNQVEPTVRLKLKVKLSTGLHTVFDICAVPNVGVVVLAQKGVYTFDQKLVLKANKGWPCPAAANQLVSDPSITFRAQTKTVLIINDIINNPHHDARQIIEYEPTTLNRLARIPLPAFDDVDKDRRLLGILSNGDLMCATTSQIWVKKQTTTTWALSWYNMAAAGKSSAFIQLLACPLPTSQQETVFFLDKAYHVHIFQLRTNGFRLQKVISPPAVAPLTFQTIFRLNCSVYTFNFNQLRFDPNEAFASEAKIRILNAENAEITNWSSVISSSPADNLVYFLNRVQKVLACGIRDVM